MVVWAWAGREAFSQEYADPIAQQSPPSAQQSAGPADFFLPSMPESGEGGMPMNPRDLELMQPGDTTMRSTNLPENNEPGHVFNKWRIIPYASVQMAFDDNIFISARNPQADFHMTLAGGIAAGWGAVRRNLAQPGGYFRQADTPKAESNPQEEGNFVYGEYSASQQIFAKHSSENAFDQDVSAAGQWRLERLLFGASVRYQTISDIDIDIGGRVQHDVLTVNATANYNISDKSNAEVDFSTTGNFYPSALDSTDTSVQVWYNYLPTGKITAGMGVKVGNLAVQESPNQIYETILLRGVYVATGKLSITASAGFEARHLDGSTRTDPVFTLGAVYAATDRTTIYLDGFRQTFSSSATAGEDISTTAVQLRVRQRLFEKLYLTLAAGYQIGRYLEVINTTLPSRTDDSFDFRIGISFDFTKQATLELAYEYRDNQSTQADKEFEQNLITLQMNLIF